MIDVDVKVDGVGSRTVVNDGKLKRMRGVESDGTAG